jgi:murein DD-endopeptidase MepM/ murein hydrolase activator NlpD
MGASCICINLLLTQPDSTVIVLVLLNLNTELMYQDEQDSQNTKAHTFHPLQFALWTMIIVLLITFIIHLLTSPQSKIIHMTSHSTPQVSHISLELASKPPWETFTVKPGDNLAIIFERAVIDVDDYNAITQLKEINPLLAQLRPKQKFNFLINPDRGLKKFVFRINSLQYIKAIKEHDKWHADVVTLKPKKKTQYTSNVIHKSLTVAAGKAGLTNKLVAKLVDIFSWDINFKKQIRPNDEFKVIYEEYYLKNKKLKSGNILAAEFITHNKTYIAIRYQTKNGSVDYYTPTGKNLRRTFLRAPLKYTRVSSKFGSKRRHPILHIVRPHEGVDLAAPFGTPIKASGDGEIIFRGRKGGYGKAIIIQHGRKYSTLYAHMSRFVSKLHVGSRVKQGQRIGYVGQTGLATGPHLHYEFRTNGIHYDPMKVKLPNARSIPKKERPAFKIYAKKMVKALKNM